MTDSFAFQSSDTWNPHMEPRLAHIMTVLFLTFSLHLIDRQVSSKKSYSSQRCSSMN